MSQALIRAQRFPAGRGGFRILGTITMIHKRYRGGSCLGEYSVHAI